MWWEQKLKQLSVSKSRGMNSNTSPEFKVTSSYWRCCGSTISHSVQWWGQKCKDFTRSWINDWTTEWKIRGDKASEPNCQTAELLNNQSLLGKRIWLPDIWQNVINTPLSSFWRPTFCPTSLLHMLVLRIFFPLKNSELGWYWEKESPIIPKDGAQMGMFTCYSF